MVRVPPRRREYDHHDVQPALYTNDCANQVSPHSIIYIEAPVLIGLLQNTLSTLLSTIVRIDLYIQLESDKHVSVLWSGNTYNFRRLLDEVAVREGYCEEAGDGTRKYYRCRRSMDITSEPNRVEDIIKNVFKNLAMKVVVESDPIKKSDVDGWIETLKELSCLHFEKAAVQGEETTV